MAASPRAPTEQEWAALTEEERRQVVDALPAGWTMAELEAQAPEGDWHREARSAVFDTLRDFFDRIGKRIYLTSDLKVYYPGRRAFAPDVLEAHQVGSQRGGRGPRLGARGPLPG